MSRGRTVLGVWGLLSILASSAQAQTAPARPFDEFRTQVSQAQASAILEIRVRWTLDRPVADPLQAAHRFDILSIQRFNESLPRDRQPMVNSQSLVVVSETAVGQALDWRIIQDPRAVRSESETAGVLTGQTLYYQQTELLLTIPALDSVSRLQLFAITPQNGIPFMAAFAVINLQ